MRCCCCCLAHRRPVWSLRQSPRPSPLLPVSSRYLPLLYLCESHPTHEGKQVREAPTLYTPQQFSWKEPTVPLDEICKTTRLNEFQHDCKLVLCLDCVDVLYYVGMTQSFKKTDLLRYLALHIWAQLGKHFYCNNRTLAVRSFVNFPMSAPAYYVTKRLKIIKSLLTYYLMVLYFLRLTLLFYRNATWATCCDACWVTFKVWP